jgi:ABC-type sulfate transport system permease component
MSRKETVLLVSRAFALFLIIWVFTEVTNLPHYLSSLFHYTSLRSVLATRDYWSSYYLTLTVSSVVRMIAFLLAAALFWRCGPRVEALFSRQQDDQEPPA